VFANSDQGIVAITVPSEDVTLSFVQPGRIAKVHLKEGDVVKAGQVLVQQDDSVERARLAQIEAESLDRAQILAGEASVEQKRVDLKRLEIAAERNAATDLELEHARLDVKIAELSLQVATFEHEQAKRKYEEAKLQIDNMSLKSPIDGIIEEVSLEAGESVNALEDVVRVVQIDPLWIKVFIPVAKARALKRGDVAVIEFPPPQKASVNGRVVFIAAVADAASGTLKVRMEVPNESHRPAGEHVEVAFPTVPEGN
jgi:RND family efflux transporter MFP subunit